MTCIHRNIRIWEQTAWDVDRDTVTADIAEEKWDDVQAYCLDCRNYLDDMRKQKAIAVVETQRGNI